MAQSLDDEAAGIASPFGHAGPARPGVLDALWDVYPDNLFLIRVEPAGEFIVEAVNPALRERFNLPLAAIEEKSIDELHGPEVSREILAHYRECLLANRPIFYEEPSRSPVAEGEVFETILMPLRDTDGRVSHLLGISRAITRLRRAEQALRQNNRELEYRLERKRQEVGQLRDSLRRRSLRDELTGCYSRGIFMEMAARELVRPPQGNGGRALLVVDLDGLKELARSFGQSAADGMVSTVVTLIRESMEPWELLGRCDSGEFILLLEREPAACEALADTLCRRIRELGPEWQGRPVSLSVSIGVALSAPDAVLLVDQLSEAAMRALAAAREQGPGHWASEHLSG